VKFSLLFLAHDVLSLFLPRQSKMADFDDSSRTLSNESVRSEDFVSDDDLSPEQIDVLLQRASERANSAYSALSTLQRPSSKLPKLNSGSLPTPYVQTVGHVARAEKSALVSDEQRRLVEKPKRVVDEQLFKKQTRLQGQSILPFAHFTARMKFYPNHFLTQNPTPFWQLICTL
jgi:hypothetical protein